MFDGENLTNAFKKQFEPILEGIGTFLAICQESAIQPGVEMTFMQSVSLPAAIAYNQNGNEEDTQNVY
ncbi:hypothetical protein TNCV_4244131 [Trichonephila clavipes]|nr:hypothetical protein TNCV_4244131 [Trichonephila clavipes]